LVLAARNGNGNVEIIRRKAGRGGKTVTVIGGFVGIGLPERERLAKLTQKACGAGSTVKDGQIEIQGDKRAEVARILTLANLRPIFAGGSQTSVPAPRHSARRIIEGSMVGMRNSPFGIALWQQNRHNSAR
jgi:translation initiation factor 1 (eIF-1/SUI1)